MWLWHVPALYERRSTTPGRTRSSTPASSRPGMAFWWYLIEPVPPRHRLTGMGARLRRGRQGPDGRCSAGARVLARRLSTTLQAGAAHLGPDAARGQNVGGLVMMLEQSLVLSVFFAILFARMLERSERGAAAARAARAPSRKRLRPLARSSSSRQRAVAGDRADQHAAGATSRAGPDDRPRAAPRPRRPCSRRRSRPGR